MQAGGGGVGVSATASGYPTQPVSQPLQTGHSGFGGYYNPITQPLGSQSPAIMQPSNESSSMIGIMQPGVPQPGGGVVSGSQPTRETTYPADAPMTWNDPPILAKKVYLN